MSPPDEDDLGEVTTLLANPCAREILAQTARESVSADDLAERCEASLTTVYRQLERLQAAGLVTASVQFDSEGHHFDRYHASLDRVTIDLNDEGLSVTVDRTEPRNDAVDRLDILFDRLR